MSAPTASTAFAAAASAAAAAAKAAFLASKRFYTFCFICSAACAPGPELSMPIRCCSLVRVLATERTLEARGTLACLCTRTLLFRRAARALPRAPILRPRFMAPAWPVSAAREFTEAPFAAAASASAGFFLTTDPLLPVFFSGEPAADALALGGRAEADPVGLALMEFFAACDMYVSCGAPETVSQ